MASSRVLSLTDPSAFARIYPSSADIEVLPAAKGKFHAEITQVLVNRMWIHGINISLPVIDTVAINRSQRSFGFLTDCNSASLVNHGTEVQHGEIVLNKSDVVHQRSGADFHYSSVSLPSDDLAATAKAIVGQELPEKFCNPTIRPPNALMDRLQRLHRAVVCLAQETPDILKSTEVSRVLETELTHALVRCLAEGHSLERTTGRGRTVKTFHRFVEFLEANPDRPLHLVEICTAIGVAERTLRSACEEFLGMGPIRYLNLRRMDKARQSLRDSDPSTTTVTQIALDHGFWEFGHFAVNYRKLFGETPSETLRNKATPTACDPGEFLAVRAAAHQSDCGKRPIQEFGRASRICIASGDMSVTDLLPHGQTQTSGNAPRATLIGIAQIDCLRAVMQEEHLTVDQCDELAKALCEDAARLPHGSKREELLQLAEHYRLLADMKRMVLRKAN